MDSTVESMLTTTPFFNPWEGCDPMPTILSLPSCVTSPTKVTIFEVPISIPTTKSLFGLFAIAILFQVKRELGMFFSSVLLNHSHNVNLHGLPHQCVPL